MLRYFLVVATLFLLPGSLAQNTDGLTLELASVIFRHGDRSPTGTFPNDEYSESDWPQGYEQLSLAGMAQHHLLGQILRNRYVTSTDFLNENYTRAQVYVRSTDVDRTLMSAEAQLSGLFPPNPDQRFSDDIAWQPIPVHTVANDQDFLLNGHNNCPTYKKLKEMDPMTEEYQQFERENQEFYEYLAAQTGFEEVNLTIAELLQDVLFAENATADKQTPSWLTPENLTQLNEIKDFIERLLVNTVEKRRLAAGPWLQKVLGDMKGKANGTLDQMKLFLYSAHDATVTIMMSALGVWDETQPPYASAFFLELYSDQDKNYFVKLFYRRNPDSEVVEQLNATSTLTLGDFENFVTPLVPMDWKKECNISTSDPTTCPPPAASSSQVGTIIILAVLFSLSFIALIVVISILLVLIIRLKRSHYHRITSDVKVGVVKT